MARYGITPQEVEDAVNQLKIQKVPISASAVRKITEKGSNTTIQKYLNELLTPGSTDDKQELINLKTKIELLNESNDKSSKEADALRLENALLEGIKEDALKRAKEMEDENERLEKLLASMYKFKKYEIVRILVIPRKGFMEEGFMENVLVLGYPKTKIDGIKKPVLCDFTEGNQKAIFDEDSLIRYTDFNRSILNNYPDKRSKYLTKTKKFDLADGQTNTIPVRPSSRF